MEKVGTKGVALRACIPAGLEIDRCLCDTGAAENKVKVSP
jgi:hypothetical protein